MAVFALVRTELIRASRRSWTYWLRTLYAAVLATILVLAWVALSGHADEWQMRPQVGHRLFRLFLWIEYGLLQGVAVLALAGAVAGERHRRTLPVLLSTRLSGWSILTGKLVAGLLPVLLLLAAGVPLVCLLLVFGGFSLTEVLAAKTIVFLSAAFAGTLALFCSTLLRSVTAVFLTASFLLALFLSLGMTGSTMHPLTALGRLLDGRIQPGAVGVPAGLLLLLTLLLLGLASLLLRLVHADAGRAGGDVRVSPAARGRMVLQRLAATTARMNPLFARERFRGWRDNGVRAAVTLGIALFPILLFSTRAQQGVWIPLLIGVVLVAVAIQAVRVFQQERMRGTLPVLLSTPSSRETLFRGGLAVAGCRAGWLAVVAGSYMAFQFALGRIGESGVLLMGAGSVLGYGFFVCALGYVAGMRMRNLGTALLAVCAGVLVVDALLLGVHLGLLRDVDPAQAPHVTMLYWLFLPWERLVLMERVPGALVVSWGMTVAIRVGVGLLVLGVGQRGTDRLLGRIS